MYASNVIRVLSFCNRSLVLSRQLLSSQQYLKPYNFVINLHRCKSNFKSKSLTSVLFSASSSPDDKHNVSKEKVPKKRRRIISSSSSSSDENESTSPSKKVDEIK